MNLGLESISSNLAPAGNLAAMPGAGAQAVSAQSGGGGFASTLAAAQRGWSAATASTVKSSSASSATVSEVGWAVVVSGSGAAGGVSLKGGIGLPPRKPASVAEIASSFVMALPPPTLPVVQISAAPSAVLSSAASVPMLPSIANGLPANGQATEQLPASPIIEPVGTVGLAVSGVLPRSVFSTAQSWVRPGGQESSPVASNTAAASPAISSKAQSSSMEPAVVKANAEPGESPFTNELASPGAAWNATAHIQGESSETNSGAATASQSAMHLSDLSNDTAPAPNLLSVPVLASVPVLLADGRPMSAPAVSTQEMLSGNSSGAQENDLPQTAPNSAPANGGEVPSEIGSLLSGMANAATPAAPALNSVLPALAQAPLGPGLAAQAVSRPVVAKMGAGTPASATSRTIVTSAPSTSPSASETEAVAASPLAGVSPFAVYFSSPGPGTESAASTLPKMILPAVNAASRAGSTFGTAAPATNSAATGAQNNPLSAVAPAPLATQVGANTNPSKDLLTGSVGASAQAIALHVDGTGVPAAAAVAQASAVEPAAAAVASVPASVIAAQSVPANPQLPGQPAATSANNAVQNLPLVPPTPPVTVPATGPVQMAQMVDRVGQAEMRVGMSTSAFGNVEVRTVVHANDVGLTIGSEKGDLRGLMSNEMPAISSSLQQQNLRLNNVSYMQGFASGNNGGGGSDGQQQRAFVPASAQTNFSSPEAMPQETSEIVSVGGFVGGGGSLSILA